MTFDESAPVDRTKKADLIPGASKNPPCIYLVKLLRNSGTPCLIAAGRLLCAGLAPRFFKSIEQKGSTMRFEDSGGCAGLQWRCS